MKKLLTLIATGFVCANSFGQTFPNAGFEIWRDYSAGNPAVSLQAPANWYGTDSLVVTVGQQFGAALGASNNFYKQLYKNAPGSQGNYSAKMVTLLQGDTIIVPGIMVNAQPAFDFLAFLASQNLASAISYTGGTPVTQQIGNVSVMAKYSTPQQGSDYGSVTVEAIKIFSGVDSVIGEGSSTIDTSSSYQLYTTDIVYAPNASAVPDKLLVIFSSSATANAIPNSTLWVDDINMSTLGVANTASRHDMVAVYPNPCKDILHINGPAGKTLTFTITSVTGQVVGAKAVTGNATENFSTLDAGIYAYSVCDDEGAVVQNGKLTVAH